MWDLIVSVPDHCLSFYFIIIYSKTLKDTIFCSITKGLFHCRPADLI